MPDARTSAHDQMVEMQIAARGIRDPRVLQAMREVHRDEFVPHALVEFAYDDAALPIDEDQTISQPYIVALILEALQLSPGDRLLDVGTGSGYAAAVASRIARHVYGIERHPSLARAATERCVRLGYMNVHVREGDGTLGWPEHAPFDAIMVGAAGPEVPPSLKAQMSIGGRLVIPVGEDRVQYLKRLIRTSENKWHEENLGAVRFVPLIGEEGWKHAPVHGRAATVTPPSLARLVARNAERFDAIADAHIERLMDRIGDARVVCLGEASHGSAEFYEMRARITRELVAQRGFSIIAIEADWPEAQRLDAYARGTSVSPHPEEAFDRFPTWMWANRQVLDFVDWLHNHNVGIADSRKRAGIYGLDLYSMSRSIAAVLRYLDDADPEAARVARRRYGCLQPWEHDPSAYGAAVMRGSFKDCEEPIVAMLADLARKRFHNAGRDAEQFFDAERNAHLVRDAERYYRIMYYGAAASWNLRDDHMFATLEAVLKHRGPDARAVVWAHNSHVGDASWTEMTARGEHNIGQLARRRYGEDAYLVGFGTDHGVVAAADDWGGEMQLKPITPSHEKSYERLCHETEIPRFVLPLRTGPPDLRRQLMQERLERAIGVIYHPRTELQSHYFYAMLPRQFDEWIWFDETRAIDTLDVAARAGMPDTYPFSL